MERFRLTLKNFRCFPDEHPLVLELGPGYTAFIGANNAGKSSALRFFYEFRHVWPHLANDGNLLTLLRHHEQPFGTGVIHDADEVSTNLNKRDMEFTFEFLDSPPDGRKYVSRFTVTFSRRRPWHTSTRFLSSEGLSVTLVQSQGATLSNGLLQIAHEAYDVTALQSVMRDLISSIYIGAFRNAINQGAAAYYDLQVGTALVALWNMWKAGSSRANMDKVLEITTTIKEMFGYRSLEINASADDKNLIVVVNGKSYSLHELGAGLAQFIIVLANVAIKAPALILIDEPELNLHPALQQRFLLQLASYASDAIIFATHSLGLARATASQIYSFRKSGDSAEVHPFQTTPHFAEMIGEMSFASYQELGYQGLLLVEGITDAPVFRQFLNLIKADHRVMVFPLGGNQLARGDVERELYEVKRLSNKVFAIVDSERSAAGASASAERTAFEAACKNVGIPVLITERRATENYLSERAIREVFGPSQRGFGPYESRRDARPSWRKDENWRVAARMTWDDLAPTDIGKFLLRLVATL